MLGLLQLLKDRKYWEISVELIFILKLIKLLLMLKAVIILIIIIIFRRKNFLKCQDRIFKLKILVNIKLILTQENKLVVKLKYLILANLRGI
jgi:hypothetical protein